MEVEVEIWKDIPNYEGIYQASTWGRIKSLERVVNNGKGFRVIKERILKPGLSSTGYYSVVLSNENVTKTHNVHILIAVVFKNHIPSNFTWVINHKDLDKTNNFPSNLEITTNRINSNKKHIKHSSKYTGVSWCESKKRWRAYIGIKGKTKYIGSFRNELDASIAYENYLI